RRRRRVGSAASGTVRWSRLRAEPLSRATAAHARVDPSAGRDRGPQRPSQPQRVAEGGGVKRITGLDWPLLALAGCLLALSAAGAIAVTHFHDAKVGSLRLLRCVPSAIAAWLVLGGGADGAGSGRALATILIVGVVMRCLLLPGTPVSNDLFRYIWDGRVQAAGFNPYLYIPSDAALSGLRDGA